MSSYADKLKQFGAGLKSGLDNWYSAYQERQAAQKAKDPMQMTRPEWQDPGSSQDMKSVYDQIMNRKDFQFDLNGNALYQQLRNSYEKQGQLGTMNAIGNASAMTGGYGNSYAAAAGQQAYQQSLEALNDRIPDLYAMALQQYQMQGEQLAQKYAVAADDRAFQYGVYRDTVGDWENDRSFYYQKQRDDVADSQWAAEFGENRRQFDENLSYQKSRAAAQDAQWEKQFGYQQFLDERNYNYQVSRDERADMESDRAFEYGAQQDALDRTERAERNQIADEQWAEEHKLAVGAANLNLLKYLSGEDQRKIENANSKAYLDLAIAQQNSSEEQRKIDNAYREKTLGIDLQKDARDYNFMEGQQGFENNLALAQFNWGQKMDIEDLKKAYLAMGLNYG